MDRLTRKQQLLEELGVGPISKHPFFKELNSQGKAYFVGGAVRDAMRQPWWKQVLATLRLARIQIKDIDLIVTGLSHDQVIRIVKKYGKVDVVGNSFGVIKLTLPGEKEAIDIALPRTETSTGGGYKDFDVQVDPNLPIEKDLYRRDFTINAIAKDAKGNPVDPYGGRQDLKDKVIRLVNPKAFSEDPLRMLRAVQFAARFGFTIEPKTLATIKQNANQIAHIPGERILIELQKVVDKKGNVKVAFDYLNNTGLFKAIFGRDFKGNVALLSKAKTLGEFVFVLLQGFDNPAEVYQKKLKGDLETVKEIKALSLSFKKASNIAQARHIAFEINAISPKVLQSKLLPSLLIKAAGDLKRNYPATKKQIAIDGNDLLKLGYKGREIGEILDQALDQIYKDKIRNKKQELLTWIQTR